jgi:hypothetical protein
MDSYHSKLFDGHATATAECSNKLTNDGVVHTHSSQQHGNIYDAVTKETGYDDATVVFKWKWIAKCDIIVVAE